MVQVTEDQTYVFKASDFTSGTLSSVKVTSLPTTGTLYLNGVPVTLNQVISASDISAGHLTFVPNTNSTGSGSFGFKVTDSLGGTTSANAAVMSIGITPGAGPLALASSVTVTEDVAYSFQASDFGYSDS